MTDDPTSTNSDNRPPFPFAVGIVRVIAIVLFGLIFPLSIAVGVNSRIEKAQGFVESATQGSYVVEQFAKNPSPFKTGNDYALIALADSERANLAVMINKQVMKLVVIYMGFAVMSFAMMFIVLGFTDGPVSGSGSFGGFTLNLQFGSLGAAVFVLGAAMAAGGGLLRNDYQTVGLPAFQAIGAQSSSLKGKLGEDATLCASFEKEEEQKACLASAVLPPPK